MRKFIFSTNREITNIDSGQLIPINIDDLPIIFNEDTLNVISEKQYQKLLSNKYLYGIQIELNDSCQSYSDLLKAINDSVTDYIVVFDATIKRYINEFEVAYFADNRLLPSKLFNIEIVQNNGCEYKTVGLTTVGQKEVIYKSAKSLNNDEFLIFKTIVSYMIINREPRIYVNSQKLEYRLSEDDLFINLEFCTANIIYDLYVRDIDELNNIRYDLIAYHWSHFSKLAKLMPTLGNFLINKAKVNDIDNFELAHIEELTIVTDEINYSQENLFYAMKYL